MRKYLRRPSPAMIVACIALVAAFAGNAVADSVDAVISALKPNSVTGKVVKNGSLTLADFSKKERAKLVGKTGKTGAAGSARARRARRARPARRDGYTKTEADAAFLGKTSKAADADKLDGIDSTGFIQGSGGLGSNYALQTAGAASDASFFDIPKLGKIAGLVRGRPAVYTVAYNNDSGGTASRYTSRITRRSTCRRDERRPPTRWRTERASTCPATDLTDLREFYLQFQRTTGIIFQHDRTPARST